MISSEVQRTLVKSPPELWAEISDPESLARHLGEFGDIRITRVQPEQLVEWEAADATGAVVIRPSGWGTKVKLTVVRELDEIATPDDAASHGAPPEEAPPEEVSLQEARVEGANAASDATQVESPAAPDHTLAPEEGPAVEPGTEATAEPHPDIEPEPSQCEDRAAPAEEPPEQPQRSTEPKRGFFARLFGFSRARNATPRAATAIVTNGPEREVVECESDRELNPTATTQLYPADETARYAELEPRAEVESRAELEPTPEAQAKPESHALPDPRTGPGPHVEPEPHAEPNSEVAAEADAQSEPKPVATGSPAEFAEQVRAAEEIAAEQVTAVLTGVLDRLGAAHHRPFSRA